MGSIASASIASTATARRVALLAGVLSLLCWATGCGDEKGAGATAVQIGKHSITVGEVEHWISALKAEAGNGREPGPPAPLPSNYAACIADARGHLKDIPASTPPIPKEPRAYCEFEYRRYKLKALYLLISYQWVLGAAAELGIRPNKPQLARELALYRKTIGLTSATAYKRFLYFRRAESSDILLSFELEQLARAVEAKVAGSKTGAQREQALAQFGKAYKARWLARTDCRSGYVVPICRQYAPGKTPATFVPPSVPLTHEPSGGG